MRTEITFYKDGDNWYFDNQIVSPTTFEIRIRNNGNGHVELIGDNNEPIFSGFTTSIKDGLGNGYVDYDALMAAVGGFFAGADFTALIQAVQNSGGTQLKAFSNTIARPANTTPYTAQDVVGSVLTIANVAKATGTGVKINRIRIQTNDTGVAGKRFNVHVFNEMPTVAADNSPLVIDWANRLRRIGAVSIVMGTGNLNTVGMNDWNTLTLSPIGRDVFIVIESADGFTPSANSTQFQVTIDTELSNN